MMNYFLFTGLIRSFLTVSMRLRSLQRRFSAVLILCLILVAFLLGAVSVSRAADGNREENEPQDLTTLSIEELMMVEVDTVSSASKYEQPTTEAPASVTIVTADDIKKYGYRNLADILQSVRGFSITNDRNYQYAGVRGFGLPGDYGTQILLLIDGVRIYDSLYNISPIGNESPLDVDMIKRVEIVRGPSYTLYGSNAMLAVINVITKQASDVAGIEVSGALASYDTYQGRLSYGKRFDAEKALLLSGTFSHSGGQDLYFPEFNSPTSNFGWARNCDREIFGSAFLKINYRDFTLEGTYQKMDKTIPTAPWGTVFNNSGTESSDSGMFVDLKYRHVFEDNLDLMARLSWNQYRFDGHYAYDWADPRDPALLITNIDRGRDSWLSGEVQVIKDVFDYHRVIGGVEFRDVYSMLQQNYDVAVNLDDRRTDWNVGTYLQDEYNLLDNLILNAGLRYDYFSTFGGTLNPRVALIYRPIERTTLKFLFGTGFRSPNGYELYYGDSATMKPNPALKEERSTSYELILEQSLGKRFRATVLGYYIRVNDLISQVTDPADGMLTYENINKAELKGLELELEKKWDNGVNGRISYSYQDAKNITTGERLPNAARHLLKLNLLVPLVEEKLFLALEEQYTGRKKTLAGSQTRDFFITNVTLFSRNLLPNLELSGSIYNLLNTKYFVPAGGEHLMDSIEQDGRSFRVKATWRF
jgi:iron complex outermembrane receptor protein